VLSGLELLIPLPTEITWMSVVVASQYFLAPCGHLGPAVFVLPAERGDTLVDPALKSYPVSFSSPCFAKTSIHANEQPCQCAQAIAFKSWDEVTF
jgi:hypothetical protein